MKTLGVECPECGGHKTRVQHSSLDVEGHRVRSRVCEDCAEVFGTVELTLPGLSYPRTQGSKRPNRLIAKPQHVRVEPRRTGLFVTVVDPERVALCKSGRHEWVEGAQTCYECRKESARALYHHTRQNAPPSILEEQRAYWRKRYRVRRERAA